jgi:hypothetical protein
MRVDLVSDLLLLSRSSQIKEPRAQKRPTNNTDREGDPPWPIKHTHLFSGWVFSLIAHRIAADSTGFWRHHLYKIHDPPVSFDFIRIE